MLSPCKSTTAFEPGTSQGGLSPSKSSVKLSDTPSAEKPAVELSEGELARDFFVDCGTHTFPYGESYQMDPNLPGEDDVISQRQICDNVENWANSLMNTVDELLAWKDQMIALHALPTNAIAGLAMISSRFCRYKGHLQDELTSMLEMTHQLIGNLLLNSHIQQYKANMIDMSVAMDNEKMVLAEEQCKLRAALAQITRMKATHRIFRWSRLSSRLRERELAEELDHQSTLLDTKREEFHQVVKGQREHIQQMSEELNHMKTFQSAHTAQQTKIVLMPATVQKQTKAMRLKSAPVRSVPFVKPENPPRLEGDEKRETSGLSPNSPPRRQHIKGAMAQTARQCSNQVENGTPGHTTVKPPSTARPSTSGSTPRSKRRQKIPEEALQLVSPSDMKMHERGVYFKETWDERRQEHKESSKQKHYNMAKLDIPETNSTPSDNRIDQVNDSHDGVTIMATHGNALVNSIAIRTKSK